VVAAVVVPVLLLAFVILYFVPGQTGSRFAWEIRPNMTAMFMGAGYLGGSWLFINTALGRPWHAVAAGFPAVTTFTWGMLLATIMHWDRFDLGHFPFQLWLVLYVVTPFLVPYLWWRNRVTDPGESPGEKRVPQAARWSLGTLGLLLLAFAVTGFVVPDWLAGIWVWQLSPLTARVLSGWFGLLGIGGLVISRDPRWSAWRVGLQCIGLWHLLVLVASMFNAEEFTAGLANWYLASVAVVLVGMVGLFVVMERR
jgi:hypothetical protein